ncbi:response regulator [Ktedonosporobacter rubrisoli]|nr:response regulator [Ktedonosporobacter rubrisoli]
MSNTFDKLSVLDSFIEEVNSYLPEIETNLERLALSPGDMDALEETYRLSHTIGGAASMMDFPGLAHIAHGMEDILNDARDGLTALDDPILGLLRRSLNRLHLLVGGIRTGVDEESVLAEDNADYAQYSAMREPSAQSEADVVSADEEFQAQEKAAPASTAFQAFDIPEPPSSTMPSFDEVLASFRAPSVMPGEELGWPEEPAPVARFDELNHLPVQPELEVPAKVVDEAPSALDELVASTRQFSPAENSPNGSPVSYESPTVQEVTENVVQPAADIQFSSDTFYTPENERYVPAVLPPSIPEVKAPILPVAYDELHSEAQTLENQAASLKNALAQLRSAVSVIEKQRSEFKGFLDGSKDALDRMEIWAGQAMGLNLRNSPEKVRRYLPLSVMWVANSKLKKVLDLLKQIANGVEMTDEQMQAVFQQLHISIDSFATAFRDIQAAPARPQEATWSPWEVQVSRDPEMLRERVTFERQGDLAALRKEVEAELREELRQEYEARPTTLAARAELEQQIRNEVRQEFEAQKQLRERVSGSANEETIRDLEARLRNEIEIQVRQEFLQQIAVSGGGETPTLQGQPPAAPTTTNFADHARETIGYVSTSPSTSTPPAQPALPPQPKPAPEVKPASTSSFANDLGEETAEIFRQEAEEHLQTISMHVAALEKAPTNRELIQGIRRATHTLKGAAGMMGFRAIADLSHISEDLLDSIMEGTTSISPAVLSLILDTAETLDVLINGRGSNTSADEARVQALRIRYTELLGEQGTSHPSAEDDIDVDADVAEDVVPDASLVKDVIADGEADDAANTQRPSRGDLTVRVRLQKLDELVNLFGEQLVNRSVLEERIQRLVRLVADVVVSSNRLRDVGQKLESRFEVAMLPSGRSIQVMPGEGNLTPTFEANGTENGNRQAPAHLEEFDELELDRYTEFHQLARGLSEGISDMATLSAEMEAVIRECENIFARENRLSTTFQDRLMKVRLVPLTTMAPRLYRAARAVALKQRKEFDFVLEGEETEVDRTVYEEIAGPLLHLMRNAVNHALETPEVRIQKGKSPVGQIKLSASYEGNQVVITVRDDGTGIDPEHVRNSAIARGLITPKQALSESDLIELIFRPGFSTAEVLSEESGRGVGLDVVRDSVSRLRGTLVVETMPGQGTAFTMKFPTSLAIQSAMMVRVGQQQFAIPTVSVETIGRLDNFKRSTLAGQPSILVQNVHYPLQMLAQYLSLPVSMLDDKAPLLLVNANGNHMALVVDEIKGKFDIVMKNLGPHLRHVHGIAGGTVLGNGRVVLILELSELLATRSKVVTNVSSPVRREAGAAGTPQGLMRQSIDVAVPKPGPTGMRPGASPAVPERGKHILVVDDSPSVRRVVGNTLKQNGWEVQTARDGVEALEMISYETPAAVLLDIEMPRMDGYELIATVRAQEQYRTLPLVVLTSRAAAKHQQRAMQLGASAYVVKPYQDENLLNTLSSLVYGAPVR